MRLTATRLSLAALSLLAACDVPTSVPKFTTEWNVPGKSTSISVNSFLPNGVVATGDNSAFQVTVSPSTATVSRSLGQDCSLCSLANGQTVPKPSFTGGGTTTIALPSGVASATLVHDTLTLSIANGFNFDPIRPSATARGYLVVRVSSGSVTVGRDSIDGNASALAAGSTTTRKVPLSGTVTGSGGLQITTMLVSPLGDPITIDMAQHINVTGSTGPFFISAAAVNLANQSVSSTATNLDLSGIDSTITDHIESASMMLTVDNPFGATGNLTMTMTGSGAPVVKPVTLSAGTTNPVISLTKDEIQSLLGNDIGIAFSGTVNGSNVSITPGQTLAVSSRLQLGINTGGK